ncbi:hypothetical protein ACFLQR_03545, partial [Verrucomicrobiota bacterium]
NSSGAAGRRDGSAGGSCAGHAFGHATTAMTAITVINLIMLLESAFIPRSAKTVLFVSIIDDIVLKRKVQ